MLAIIRSDFERIHSDLGQLKPEALVPLPDHANETIPYDDLLVREREREYKFRKPIRGTMVDINVRKLLDGVDLDGIRRRPGGARRPAKVFYSYSHNDEALRNTLETHLKLLQRSGLITEWHDRRIEAGDEWKRQIDEHLESADIILLLISADFMASDYCYKKEMKRALERHKRGEARVVPIVVREVNLRLAPFARLQTLPPDGRAVLEWPSQDAAWRAVSEGIERIARDLRRTRDRKPWT